MFVYPVSREGLHRPERVQSQTAAGRAVTGTGFCPSWHDPPDDGRSPGKIMLVFVDRGWPRFNEPGYFEPIACGI
jgi:hypothetical protein